MTPIMLATPLSLSSPGTAQAPPGAASGPQVPRRRHRVLWMTAAAAHIGIATLLCWYALYPPDPLTRGTPPNSLPWPPYMLWAVANWLLVVLLTGLWIWHHQRQQRAWEHVHITLQNWLKVSPAARSAALTPLDPQTPPCGPDWQAALTQAQDRVYTLFRHVRTDATDIHNNAHTLSQTASDLVESAQKNEAALMTAADSVMNLSVAIHESSDSVSKVKERAHTTLQTSQQGEAMVEQAALTMDSINTSSTQVRGLIQVIENIAFQTNLLALNAAVEAARAGNAGRGFAVVANEVRQLAHRTTSAASDVRAVISSSVDELAMGTALMREAGSMMRNTVTEVRGLADELSCLDIAVSTQRDQVAQINDALIEFNDMLTHHAATATATSKAARDFDTCAQSLLDHANTTLTHLHPPRPETP